MLNCSHCLLSSRPSSWLFYPSNFVSNLDWVITHRVGMGVHVDNGTFLINQSLLRWFAIGKLWRVFKSSLVLIPWEMGGTLMNRLSVLWRFCYPEQAVGLDNKNARIDLLSRAFHFAKTMTIADDFPMFVIFFFKIDGNNLGLFQHFNQNFEPKSCRLPIQMQVSHICKLPTLD